jgi:hypothetical protein
MATALQLPAHLILPSHLATAALRSPVAERRLLAAAGRPEGVKLQELILGTSLDRSLRTNLLNIKCTNVYFIGFVLVNPLILSLIVR